MTINKINVRMVEQLNQTNLKLYSYNKWTTCRKAKAWLKSNDISFEEKDIMSGPPTSSLFNEWVFEQGIPVKTFYNSAGAKYRELNMKERIKFMTDDELVALLASHGSLVKRPILTDGTDVLVGFKEEEWQSALIGEDDSVM